MRLHGSDHASAAPLARGSETKTLLLLPISTPAAPRGDWAAAVLLAFAAGLLLGVPVTFCALYVVSLGEAPHGPAVFPRGTAYDPRGALDPSDLVEGVFWTELSEAFAPRGFGPAEDTRWHHLLNASRVLRMEEGCGRMQNRLLTLTGGRRACSRFRFNSDQIQGEIFSFYLGRLLGLRNLAPSALAAPDARSGRWSATATSMAAARWTPNGRPVVLTRFVDRLSPAFVPRPLRRAPGARTLRPVREDLSNLTATDVSELVQWSDLIVFDYLTANLDRVVNNLFNERWDAGMMSRPAHNLARTQDGLLLFLDNESGLLHGYRLLDKYEPLHRGLLDALCVFRARTVRALESVRRDVRGALAGAFARGDPGMEDRLPFLPDANIRTLEQRMDRVLHQVQICRSTFPSANNR